MNINPHKNPRTTFHLLLIIAANKKIKINGLIAPAIPSTIPAARYFSFFHKYKPNAVMNKMKRYACPSAKLFERGITKLIKIKETSIALVSNILRKKIMEPVRNKRFRIVQTHFAWIGFIQAIGA